MFKKWAESVPGCVQNINNNEVATLSCIPVVFLNLLSALLAFAGLIALIMFMLGGFKLMASQGDPKQLQSADNNFKFGIIGLSIVLFSFLAINIISQITGVKCITVFGFNCTP